MHRYLLMSFFLFLVLFSFSCTEEGTVSSEEEANIDLNLIWMAQTSEVVPENIYSLRITITSNSDKMIDSIVLTFDYSSGKGEIEGVPIGIPVDVEVEAIDDNGEVLFSGIGSSENTIENTSMNVIVYKQAPRGPSNLVAEVSSSNQVVLTWNDNSSYETGTILERRAQSGSFDSVCIVNVNDTMCIDSGVIVGGSYEYRVIALNDIGRSTSSNTVAVLENDFNLENRPPVMSTIGNKSVKVGDTLIFNVSATDLDNDLLKYYYESTSVIAGAQLDSLSGAFSWSPNSDQTGNFTVKLLVSDGLLKDSAVISIVVDSIETNTPIIEPVDDTLFVDENDTLKVTFKATDADGDSIKYSIVGIPSLGNSVLNENTGEFEWITNYEQAGSYQVTLSASDGFFSSEVQFVIVVNNVNRKPELGSMGNKSATVGEPLIFKVSATDQDGNSITYSMGSTPKISGHNFSSSSGEFQWTPISEQIGEYSVTFKASDGDLEDSLTIKIYVADDNSNVGPVLTQMADTNVSEGEALLLTMVASDENGDSISFSYSSTPDMNGAVLDSNSGQFNWTPGFNDAGEYMVTVSASDGFYSDEKSFRITVKNSNRAPNIMDTISSVSGIENSPISFVISAEDPDKDDINFSMISSPTINGAQINENSGQFSWTPSSSESGIYDLTIYASDGELKDSIEISITVDNKNQKPTITDTITVVNGKEQKSIDLTISATDPDNDSLTFAMSSTPSLSGATMDSVSGAFSWTPTFNDSGSYTVTFFAADKFSKDSITVEIIVADSNRAPVMEEITNKNGTSGSAVSFTISANDLDGNDLTFSMTSQTIPQSAFSSAGQFNWTPNYNEIGVHEIVLIVSDGIDTDSDTINITVTSGNSAPVFDAVSNKNVFVGSELTFQLSATDGNSDPLTYSIVSSTIPNSVLSSSGLFSWTPTTNDEGSHTAKFVVTDSYEEDSVTITVTVDPVVVIDNSPIWVSDVNGNMHPYNEQNGDWDPKIGGVADIIDGYIDGNKWCINSNGSIFMSANGGGWGQKSPLLMGIDIAVGKDSVWMIDNGNVIYSFNWETDAFEQRQGLAVKIDVDADGNPWCVTTDGTIFQSVPGSGWVSRPGITGADIGCGKEEVWAVATDKKIYRYDFTNSSWEETQGLAVSVDVDSDDNAWIINDAGQVFEHSDANGWESRPGIVGKDVGCAQ